MSYGRLVPGSGFDTAPIIVAVVFLVLALIGAIVLHFTFLSRKNEGRFTGFLGWLYDFLTFKKLYIEGIIKLFYVINVIFLCVVSIIVLFVSDSFFAGVILFLLILFVGNLLLRITYEGSLIMILICRNIMDINHKLKGKGSETGTGQSQAAFENDWTQSMKGTNPFAKREEPPHSHSTQEDAGKGDGVIYCVNCGAKIEREDAKFCTRCGYPRK